MSKFPFTVTSTSRLGVDPSCQACGAGAVLSFDWRYANERRDPDDLKRIEPLTHWMELRRGSLFRCQQCSEVWHLDGNAKLMTQVEPGRLPLVLDWNRKPIVLPADVMEVLQHIGPTPPDVYGNGSERRVTPCEVTTQSGEIIETAMVCIQLDAPVEAQRRCRLGSEIAAVRESRFALPRAVREASSRAEEMRMGFSPTLIEMPDGSRFVMNGMTSFMAVQGYAASDARVAIGSYFSQPSPPPFIESPKDLVHFIIDGDPGWCSSSSGKRSIMSSARRWLAKWIS